MWALLWLIAVYPFHTLLHEGMHYLVARLFGREAEIYPWPARIGPEKRRVFGYSIYFGPPFQGRQLAIFSLAPLMLELVWWTACGVPLLIWGRVLPLWAFLLITIESFAAIGDSFVLLFGFWTKTPKQTR
jgi:hypothetical protein